MEMKVEEKSPRKKVNAVNFNIRSFFRSRRQNNFTYKINIILDAGFRFLCVLKQLADEWKYSNLQKEKIVYSHFG